MLNRLSLRTIGMYSVGICLAAYSFTYIVSDTMHHETRMFIGAAVSSGVFLMIYTASYTALEDRVEQAIPAPEPALRKSDKLTRIGHIHHPRHDSAFTEEDLEELNSLYRE